MDFSVYNRTDFESKLKLLNAEAMIENKNPFVVTLCAFKGAKAARQLESFETAISAVTKKYAKKGITINYDSFDNDEMRSKLGYSPSAAVDRMLRADIHLLPTHFHQGNLQGDIRPGWNMYSINSNLDRLEFHLGIPMAEKIRCPVHRQDKVRIYSSLSAFSVPTISIPLLANVHENKAIIATIKKFVIQIKNDPRFSTEDEEFCCKLPYTTNGNIGGLAITKKHSIGGLEGILSSLRQWVEGANSSLVLGIIPEVIIQPYILNNSEAKVLCFNGKSIARNPHKRGEGRSTLGRNEEAFVAFAEAVIGEFKKNCPQLIFEQLLRVDMFHYRGVFYMNEVEGVESQRIPLGSGKDEMLTTLINNYWYKRICECVDFLLRRRGITF